MSEVTGTCHDKLENYLFLNNRQYKFYILAAWLSCNSQRKYKGIKCHAGYGLSKYCCRPL